MFCPKCKAEFFDGYTVCVDCHVDLVEEPPKESSPRENHADIEIPEEFESISSMLISDIWAIPLIKSIFEEEKIEYFMQGENTFYIQPGVQARMMVRKDQVERALEIMKDVLNNNTGTIDLE
jgi:hypothetical protein